MPDHRSHRGPHPEDRRLFSPEQAASLGAAIRDLSWLLTRECALPSSLKLVGDRYQLAARQRIAVSRCACSDQQFVRRTEHQRQPGDLTGSEIWIDGYNVLTTLEAALSGGVIIRGRDGCLRDMASMHGSYRQVFETVPAIELIGNLLDTWHLSGCRWLLDQPVSNSGRLRSALLQTAERRGWNWTVDLVPDPDPLLARARVCVATADSQILQQVETWVSLAEVAVLQFVPRAWILDLSGREFGNQPERSRPK